MLSTSPTSHKSASRFCVRSSSAMASAISRVLPCLLATATRIFMVTLLTPGIRSRPRGTTHPLAGSRRYTWHLLRDPTEEADGQPDAGHGEDDERDNEPDELAGAKHSGDHP